VLEWGSAGGGPAVAAAVDDLYARVLGDRELAHYCTGIEMARQKTHLIVGRDAGRASA
jgi:hypothetical protein